METQTYYRVHSWARPYNGDVVKWFDTDWDANDFAMAVAVNTGRGVEVEKVER